MPTTVFLDTVFGLTTAENNCFIYMIANVDIDGAPAPDGTAVGWKVDGFASGTSNTFNGGASTGVSKAGAGTMTVQATIGGVDTGNLVTLTFIDVGDPCANYSPDAPVLSAIAGNGEVALGWTDALPGTPYFPAFHYEVLRGTTPGGGTHLADTYGLSHVDTTAVNGTTYYYKVRARVAFTGGFATDSNEVSATPTGAMTVSFDGIRIPLFAVLAGYNQIDYGTGY